LVLAKTSKKMATAVIPVKAMSGTGSKLMPTVVVSVVDPKKAAPKEKKPSGKPLRPTVGPKGGSKGKKVATQRTNDENGENSQNIPDNDDDDDDEPDDRDGLRKPKPSREKDRSQNRSHVARFNVEQMYAAALLPANRMLQKICKPLLSQHQRESIEALKLTRVLSQFARELK
jgi:hypothetical protein